MREHGKTFSRAVVVSVIATGAEFVVLALLAHLANLPHWLCYGGVQFLGTAITFLLNKYWAFEAGDAAELPRQGARSAAVFAGSFVLNTALPSVGSYVLHREPVLSFAVAQVLVYLGWNYPMNKYWVFKKPGGDPDDKITERAESTKKRL